MFISADRFLFDEDVATQLSSHMINYLTKAIPHSKKTKKKKVQFKLHHNQNIISLYHQHNTYNKHTAQQWIADIVGKRIKIISDDPHTLKEAFMWALINDDQPWVDIIAPYFKHGRIDHQEHNVRKLIHNNQYEALGRVVVWLSPVCLESCIMDAVATQNTPALHIMLPHSNPRSKKSHHLQWAANLTSSTDVLEELITHSDPVLAARECVYKEHPAAADAILSHPATPVTDIEHVMDYAFSKGQQLPLAFARYERYILEQQTLGGLVRQPRKI